MKRIISLLLTMVLVIGMLPAMSMVARADDETHDHGGGGITFAAWNDDDSLPTSGSYYLDTDVVLSSTWTLTGTAETPITINLCLNGHSIKYTGSSGSVISVGNYATLNIYECNMAGEHRYSFDSNGLAIVDDTLTGNYHTFNGGYITGGKGTTGNYTVVYGGGIYIDGGGTVNMYGGTIIGNTAGQGGGIYNIGTLSVSNVSFIGNTADFGGGICHGNTAAGIPAGSFTMDSVYIRENKATLTGGGIYAVNAFTMSDGVIIGNTSERGGGVYNIRKYNMTGGTIAGNTATKTGGGVYNSTFGEFAMSGGTIKENSAVESGGGVYNHNVFTMTGGSIVNNTAGENGGGVYCLQDSHYTSLFSVSGNPKIKENSSNNVYLSNGLGIAITDDLTDGASIGVTLEDEDPTERYFAVPGITPKYEIKPSDALKFFSDDSKYIVTRKEVEPGYYYLYLTNKPSSSGGGTPTYYVSFDPNGGTGEMERIRVVGGKVTLPENGFTAPEVCYFDGWEDPDGVVYQPGTEYKTTRSVTMKARWFKKGFTKINAGNIPKTYDGKPYEAKYTVSGSKAEPVVTYYKNNKKPLETAPVDAGTYYYKVSVPEDDRYLSADTGYVPYKINKASNPFKVKTVKKIAIDKNETKSLKANAVFVLTGAVGKVTYAKKGKKPKEITVKKNGTIRIEKALKGKKYKFKVKIKAAGNKNYKSKSNTVTVKVKVKN